MSVVRSNNVEKIDGGLSHLLKLLLHKCFSYPYDLRQGVYIDLSFDSPILLFGEVYCMVQDLAAHKMSTLCKGHSAHRVCPLCQNVVSLHCPWLPDPAGLLHSIASFEVEKFASHTDATILATLKRLQNEAHAAREPSQLATLQTQLGFNHSDENLFLCPTLSLGMKTVVMFDWVHIMFIGGIFAVEMTEQLARRRTHNLG